MRQRLRPTPPLLLAQEAAPRPRRRRRLFKTAKIARRRGSDAVRFWCKITFTGHPLSAPVLDYRLAVHDQFDFPKNMGLFSPGASGPPSMRLMPSR